MKKTKIILILFKNNGQMQSTVRFLMSVSGNMLFIIGCHASRSIRVRWAAADGDDDEDDKDWFKWNNS